LGIGKKKRRVMAAETQFREDTVGKRRGNSAESFTKKHKGTDSANVICFYIWGIKKEGASGGGNHWVGAVGIARMEQRRRIKPNCRKMPEVGGTKGATILAKVFYVKFPTGKVFGGVVRCERRQGRSYRMP